VVEDLRLAELSVVPGTGVGSMCIDLMKKERWIRNLSNPMTDPLAEFDSDWSRNDKFSLLNIFPPSGAFSQFSTSGANIVTLMR
jgi:hypothetical protein